MKKTMFYLLAVAGLAGCADDPITPDKAFLGGSTVETDASWKMDDWKGGKFRVKVNPEFLKQAQVKEWTYRVLYDGEIEREESVAATVPEVEITVPVNPSDRERRIQVEVKIPKAIGGAAVWQPAVDMKQASAFVNIDGIYWAPGNLTVKDGAFEVALAPEETGLYFEHMSTYGIPSEGSAYGGICYTPEEKTVALADIPKNGDPCKLVKGADLRMPTLYEMEKLYDADDYESKVINGVTGFLFGGGKLFLPLAGGCDRVTGSIGFKNTNGAYWYSGEDDEGNGGLLALSEGYTFLYYNLGPLTASVRCVRNIAPAAYVSHTPQTLESSAKSTVRVVTTPGDMDGYAVTLADGAYEIRAIATAEQPEVELEIPENTDLEEIVYTLFVNGEPTGKQLVQPGITDYGFYQSHSPKGPVPADAFTLTVNCLTDKDALAVEVKDGGDLALKETVSKANPIATFSIPANEGEARTLTIYVNGLDTGKKVVQEAPANRLSVVWSTGYLTVKDGAYTFAGEQEKGMYFKYNSRYGLTLDATGKKYSGTAYGPAEVTKAYADVAAKEVDPCSLVAPAGTWRTPTKEEWLELLTYPFEWEMDKFRAFSDGDQTVYITPSGSINATGTGMLQTQWAKAWSSTVHVTDASKNYTLIGTFSSRTGVFNCTIGTVHDQALMVRCVRAK